MSVLSKDEFMARLKARIGDDTSDESIADLEDFADTWADWEQRYAAANDGDWKTKYEENDRQWRDKYTKRFFSAAPEDSEHTGENATRESALAAQNEDVREDGEMQTFDALFAGAEGGF